MALQYIAANNRRCHKQTAAVNVLPHEMKPCRAPCHRGRMGPVGADVVGAGAVAVEAGVAVAGAEVVAKELS